MGIPSPHVIILNGPSSSGKTSLARAIQEHAPRLLLNFSIDAVLYSLPQSDLSRMIEGAQISRKGYSFSELETGYWKCVRALADAGNKIIADNALVTREQKRFARTQLSGIECCWIGVYCDEEQLACREENRGDRAIGLARSQCGLVHSDMSYDLEVDTTRETPAAIAKTIVDRLFDDSLTTRPRS